MINFTVGPVQMDNAVREIGYEQIPYFRTPEFSEVMFENEKYIKEFSGATEKSRVVFITGSGTASMEATIMNTLTEEDKVLVVNGGGFGQRFVDLCKIHNINYTDIRLDAGKALREEDLGKYDNKGYTAFVVNIHETSTGVLYDIELISRFCKKNNLFLIVDAISSFLADEINMEILGIDVMIAGSQKALACPPGISIIVLSERAINRVNNNKVRSLYFDLKPALKDGERGQTPFTPAVGILLQINARLKDIAKNGGVDTEVNKVKSLAADFREKIVELPFEIVSESMSNAVTPVHPITASASEIFNILKDEYNIWVCPNGGELKDYLFRVGHIGELTKEDNDKLISALCDIKARGII